jgi:hypothetical protein
MTSIRDARQTAARFCRFSTPREPRWGWVAGGSRSAPCVPPAAQMLTRRVPAHFGAPLQALAISRRSRTRGRWPRWLCHLRGRGRGSLVPGRGQPASCLPQTRKPPSPSSIWPLLSARLAMAATSELKPVYRWAPSSRLHKPRIGRARAQSCHRLERTRGGAMPLRSANDCAMVSGEQV